MRDTDPRARMFATRPLSEVGARLLSGSTDRRFPLSATWELTGRCNLRCRMCYTDPMNRPERIRDELSFQEIVRILDELQAAGCLEITFTGGEPASRPDFPEIYDAAQARGFLVSVFTNGTLLPERLAALWKRRPPARVEVSVHAMEASLFDAVTQQPGSFERCMQTIYQLVAMDIPLVIKTTVTTINRDAAMAVKSWAMALGPRVQFRLGEYLRDDVDLTGAPLAFQLAEEDLDRIAALDADVAREREAEVAAEPASVCGGGGERFHIDAYGRLQLCSGNRRGGYDLRRGTFHEGFYAVLPALPCPRRQTPPVRQGFQPLPVLESPCR